MTSTGEQVGAVAHTGRATLGARVVPGLFAQTHGHPEFVGRSLLDILHRGDERRAGMPRDAASSALDRYGLVRQALQRFDGTVLAVTHDRWFARSFDRFLVFGSDGDVYESDAPVWTENRVTRAR